MRTSKGFLEQPLGQQTISARAEQEIHGLPGRPGSKQNFATEPSIDPIRRPSFCPIGEGKMRKEESNFSISLIPNDLERETNS
jgi:hypothetical protein